MICSFTIGLPLGHLAPAAISSKTLNLIERGKSILTARGISPRTVRLTLPAFGRDGETEGAVLSSLRWVDELANEQGARWFCLPIDLCADGPYGERLLAAQDAVARFPRMFLNMIVANNASIAMKAVGDAADSVLKIARLSGNGFDNFRVGMSCNCPANAPFFPFSRHEGQEVAFSFALETTGIALNATKRVGSDVVAARQALVDALVPQLKIVEEIGHEIEVASQCRYKGMDASLAPFPDGNMSVATLIEQLLGSLPGSAGSVFVTAVLTDAIREAIEKSGATAVGFNGVMYSLLEDDFLAKANNQRKLNLESLVSLAAVCGCGIDMVPVSGSVFKEEIAGLTLDIAAMSCTLKKPLGVRLLPIPGRSVNEFTQFNLDFLCDSRIVNIVPNDRDIFGGSRHLTFQAPLFGRIANE